MKVRDMYDLYTVPRSVLLTRDLCRLHVAVVHLGLEMCLEFALLLMCRTKSAVV